MRKRITKNRYILFILVFFISLGFAYLSANLNILGALSYNAASFDVHFDDLVLDNESYVGAVLPTLNQEKDTISMNFSFDKPGDKLIYTADIINSGTIDAQLGDLNITNNLSSSNSNLLDLSIKYLDGIDVKSGDVILKGARKTIKVIVGYSTNIEVSDLPTEVVPFTIEIGPGFDQCDLSSLTKATFTDGSNLHSKMQSLTGVDSSVVVGYNHNLPNVIPSYLETDISTSHVRNMAVPREKEIHKFIRSYTLKENLTNDNIASTDESDLPIYMWFEDANESIYGEGTIYWYSDADIIYLNEVSSYAFNEFKFLDDISGLMTIDILPGSNFSSFFRKCSSLSNFSPIANWSIANIYLNEMFFGCESFTDISQLKKWNGSYLSGLFAGLSNLVDISPLKDFDFSNVEDISYLFDECTSLTDISVIADLDLSNVTNIDGLFSGCSSLTDISPLSSLAVSNLLSLDELFLGCTSLSDLSPISNWNVSNVRYMDHLFQGCTSLSDLSPISNWDVSNVINLSDLFSGCTSLIDLSPISNWNVQNVTSMIGTFKSCSSLIDLSPLSSWNTSSLEKMYYTFTNCISLVNVSQLANWNVSNVSDMNYLFEGCASLSNIQGLSNWNVSNVKRFGQMFFGCSSLNDISALSNWNVSNATHMELMFNGCTSLIDASCLESWVINENIYYSNMFGSYTTIRPSWYV